MAATFPHAAVLSSLHRIPSSTQVHISQYSWLDSHNAPFWSSPGPGVVFSNTGKTAAFHVGKSLVWRVLFFFQAKNDKKKKEKKALEAECYLNEP